MGRISIFSLTEDRSMRGSILIPPCQHPAVPCNPYKDLHIGCCQPQYGCSQGGSRVSALAHKACWWPSHQAAMSLLDI